MEDFVNCLNYHCNMQMQICTNEDSRVYGSKIYIAGNGENKIKIFVENHQWKCNYTCIWFEISL